MKMISRLKIFKQTTTSNTTEEQESSSMSPYPPEQKNLQKRVFISRSPWKATQANRVGTPNCKHPAQQPSSPVADSPIPPNGFLHPVSINNMCCNFTTSGVLLYQNLGHRLHYSTTVFHYMFTTFLLHFAFRVHFVSGSVICDPCA